MQHLVGNNLGVQLQAADAFLWFGIALIGQRCPLPAAANEMWIQEVRWGDARLGVVGGPNQNLDRHRLQFSAGGRSFNVLRFGPTNRPLDRRHAEAVPDEHPTFIRYCSQPRAEVRLYLSRCASRASGLKDPK